MTLTAPLSSRTLTYLIDFLKKRFLLILIALLLFIFAAFTLEVREADAGQAELVGHLDGAVLKWTTGIRNPVFTKVAMDVTALGSTTVLILISIFGLLLFTFHNRMKMGLHLISATSGASLISFLMKTQFERSRPPFIGRLVDVQGYSYPSGHTLAATSVYLTLALIAVTFYPKTSHRIIIICATFVLICLIAYSRVYLGVHFPTDVCAGILLGSSWALLISFFNPKILDKKSPNLRS